VNTVWADYDDYTDVTDNTTEQGLQDVPDFKILGLRKLGQDKFIRERLDKERDLCNNMGGQSPK